MSHVRMRFRVMKTAYKDLVEKRNKSLEGGDGVPPQRFFEFETSIDHKKILMVLTIIYKVKRIFWYENYGM